LLGTVVNILFSLIQSHKVSNVDCQQSKFAGREQGF
jgi:hypothetical protein